MEEQSVGRMNPGISDVVLRCVMLYIDDPEDRDSVSLVCRQWYEIDALTRNHVTIAFCYATTPGRLRSRFPNLESLKLKGQPRAAMFELIPYNWGGYAAPWVKEMAESFTCLKSIHFRRMIVTDSDLRLLLRTRGRGLLTLKIDKCYGFSTDGLFEVGRHCGNLKHLFLEESIITEKDCNWLHQLATNNTVLETLNFYMTGLDHIRVEDLELLASKCRSLCSVKIGGIEILNLVGFFRAIASLEEFYGASFNDSPDKYSSLSLPNKLSKLGLLYLGGDEMHLVFPFASLLKKLDLLYVWLETDDFCTLLERCPNLEFLETIDALGDRGLEVVGRTCKRLKGLRIEEGAKRQGMENEEGFVTQRGLIALAHGCLELEYLAVYASDITNTALVYFGIFSKNLRDFRLVLLKDKEYIAGLPLDQGVRALLIGCEKLRRFALYLRPGGLTDVGLSYVGKYGRNIRWMLLGCLGQSDAGLLELSTGCPSLRKLEMRSCFFSEHALAVAVTQLTSLRYFWIQGYNDSRTGRDLLAMARPYWNIELISARRVRKTNVHGRTEMTMHLSQILAYYSLAGRRTDFPATVRPLFL